MKGFVFIVTVGIVHFLYGGLTIYGMVKYPYFNLIEKIEAGLIAAFIPLIGPYLVNRSMGHRLSDEAKLNLAYELPWWVRIGIPREGASFDDD